MGKNACKYTYKIKTFQGLPIYNGKGEYVYSKSKVCMTECCKGELFANMEDDKLNACKKSKKKECKKCKKEKKACLQKIDMGPTVCGVDTSIKLDGEETSGEETGGSGVGFGILIGITLGAIAMASLVGAIAYREWSRRNISVGQVNVVHETKGQFVSNPLHVDHIAEVCLSETSNLDFSESSEQSYDHLILTDSLGAADSFNDDKAINGSSKEKEPNSTREGIFSAGTDFPEDMIGFTTEQPMFQRSYSALCAEEAGVPLDVIQEVLTREGRVESDRARVLLAAQEVLNSRNDTTDYRSINEMSAVISTDVTNSSAPSA